MENKNKLIFWLVILAVGTGLIIWSNFGRNKGGSVSLETPTATPSISASPSPLPAKSPSKTPSVGADVSCELKGEIKFLNSNTYDNQDALFIYRGIDDPGRNILWNVSPQDDIRVGPNIFARIPIPDGESLLGVFLPENPKYKRYELTAKIQYGQLVDYNVKVFEKQCNGKTVVVLP